MAEPLFEAYGRLFPELRAEVRRRVTSYRGRIWLSQTCWDERKASPIRPTPEPLLSMYRDLTMFNTWQQRREAIAWFDEAILTPLDALVDLAHGEPFIMDAAAIWTTRRNPAGDSLWAYGWARIEFRPRTPPVDGSSYPGDMWLTIPTHMEDERKETPGPWRVDRFKGPRAVPGTLTLALHATHEDAPSNNAVTTSLEDLQTWLRERRAEKDLPPYVPDPPLPDDDPSDSV